ncbi:MAG: bis(5'-nucleosyl)-tetraphosphatase (symmetrical) YqeK [Treponema sp.]|nr:bis(5'-nucleosyl)-tetraphosphatase (symmetrical) YqeK [Treponema sp.]
MDYLTLTEEIRQFTEQSVKKSRYEHSLRVAQMCARICRFYRLDADKGYLIGIAHDMCKDLPAEQMISTASRDGFAVLELEVRKPSLLHGRAAAVLMKEKFGVKDKQMLEAIAVHTYGKVGMCDLSKALFIADKIEPGRPQATPEYIENLFTYDFDGMFRAVLEENYEYVSKKGFEIYPETESVMDFYIRNLENKENKEE